MLDANSSSPGISPCLPRTPRPGSDCSSGCCPARSAIPRSSCSKAAVSERWSANSDLIDAVEHVSRQALLDRAEREDRVDEVEDQLFRFARILEAQPRLAVLLGDYEAPAEGRVGLLRNVLSSASGGSNTITNALAGPDYRAVARPVGRRGRACSWPKLAVARRNEVVAQVSAAAEPSDAQRTRLTEVLSRIYGHPVAVQLQIDPALLGGLLISVGDEVIDGTLSSRLAAAETQLPD